MTVPIKLSVNINKIALIRNSRPGNNPDLLKIALDCESFGADGITIHPRPDERHARLADIASLKEVLSTELNVEGNPTELFLSHVLKHKPHQCTLVPDAPHALTSDSGWNTKIHLEFLKNIVVMLKESGIRTSIFIDPDEEMIKYAADTGTDRVELFTGNYAHGYLKDPEKAVVHHVRAAKTAGEVGLGINAGHDLNLENLHYYASHIPGLLEVSIGHALVTDALYYGLSNIIPMYKHKLSIT